MNWLDIVIIAALLLSTVIGLFQGFVMTLFSLAGTIAGVVLAANFYERAAAMLGFIPSTEAANIIAFVIILLATWLVATLIGSALKSLLSALNLGWADRIIGAGLGLLLGALAVSAVLAGFVTFFGQDPVADSFMARMMLDKLPALLGLLPEQFRHAGDFF